MWVSLSLAGHHCWAHTLLVLSGTIGAMATIEYCSDCTRIKGVGCACGLSFAEKVRSIPVHLGTFRAVR